MHSIEPFAQQLKKAREKKGLSQRVLSEKTGLTQSQISQIENGKVDLQLSSFIELARSLDLEPMLIHRTLVPTVEGIQYSLTHQLEEGESLPMYRLDEEDDDV